MGDPSVDPDPKCDHDKIDIVGGGGDAEGFWETFQCRQCGWKFHLRTLDE